MKRKSADSLAPGFRFHPTDEELVRYYLKRKVSQKPLRFDPISEIEVYKAEPWDLPDKSRLKTRDLEWYFFSALDKKYGSGSKTNRATEKGYWKTTGKDRAIRHGSRTVGMKKTLVYHFGRAPRGDRTNWVMHEYRLTDEELDKAGISQDAFVLCRIFQKSGSGPKNGEQYGAPFVEEEWEEDDEVSLLPAQEVFTGQVLQTDDLKFDANELNQNLNFGISTGDVLQSNGFYHGDTSNSSELDEALVDDNCKAQNSIGESILLQDNLIGLPEQYQVNVAPVKQEEYSQSPNDLNGLKLDDLLDGIFMDASDNPAFGDTPFLQTGNPSVSAVTSAADLDLDEFFNFYDAEDNIFMNTDSSQMMMVGVDNNYIDESFFASNISNQTTQADLSETSQLFAPPQEHRGSSLLKKEAKSDELNWDNDYQLSAKSSNFWDNLPAPPAYASEFPSKDALLKLGSVIPSSQASSSSAHTTAATVRIRNMTLSGNGMDLSFGKNGEVNLVLSFQLADDGPVCGATTSAKTTSSTSWRWLYCLFLSAVLIPVSFKFGSFIWSS